ncbi:hypothetical protein HN747_02425 [archaeon]|nr:hypothetical protein [archaeon]
MIKNPEWEITDKRLKRLDLERTALNVAVASFERQLYGDPFPYASLSTGNDIYKRARSISRGVARINKDDLCPFDRAVYQDVSTHGEMASAYHSYFIDIKSKMRIGKFLSDFYEPGIFTGFLNSVRPENMPHDELYEEALLMSGAFTKTPDSLVVGYGNSALSKRNQRKLVDALGRSVDIVNPFYESLGIVPVECDIELGPAGGGFSYWLGGTSMAVIDPDRFSFSSGTYDTFLPSLILAHELGHAQQEKQGNNLPSGLNPSASEYSVSFHGQCGEGAALAIEGEFVDYSKKKKIFSQEDQKKMELFWSTYLPKKRFQIAHDLLERQWIEEMANPDFPESLKRNAHVELARITNIKCFEDDFSFCDFSAMDSLQQMSYHIGNKNIRRIMNRFKKEGVPRDLSFNAILQGVWVNSRAQEDFIFNSYLPRMMGK